MSKYDWKTIHEYRLAGGWTWAQIVEELKLDVKPKTLRTSYSRWRTIDGEGNPLLWDSMPGRVLQSSSITVELPHVNLKQVHSLDDLIRVLEIDMDEWRVSNFKGNAWEQSSTERGTVTLLQVKASL